MPLSQVNFPHKAPTFGFLPATGQGSITALGNVFFVDSASANAANATGNGKRPDKPFATIDYAVGQCTANNGDVIFVAPGHTEDVSAAGSIDLDVAGIRVVGLGNGRDRATITFSATGGDIDVDAANITFEGFHIDITGVDAVTAAIDVNAADFTLRDCEILMADSAGQATRCVVGATAADRLRVINNVVRSTDAGAASFVNLVGTADGTEIAHNHIYGDFSVAAIENATSNVLTNLSIHHNYIQNDNNGNFAIELVSACTGVIYDNYLVTDAVATAADWGACQNFRNYYADDGDADTKAIEIPLTSSTGSTQDLTNVIDALYGSTGIATWPASAAPANGVSMAEALRYMDDALQGTNGVVTWAAGAAPANGVSIAEGLRYVSEIVAGVSVTQNPILGIKVNKTAFTLPASTTGNIFTVSGGRVLVTLLTGEVTTVVQAQACNLSVVHVTTVGGDITLASTVDINADEAGTLYVVEGDGTALVPQSSGAVLYSSGSGPMVLAEGTMNITTSATNTGATSWELWYFPLDSGASVASA